MRLAALAMIGWVLPAVQQAEPPAKPCGADVFERTVRVLAERYYDRTFAQRDLERLADRFRQRAAASCALDEQRSVTFDLLTRIPTSHLSLISGSSYRRLIDELWGRSVPSTGFELYESSGAYYAQNILDGGPAERGGLRLGDRVVAINGAGPDSSPLVDWRTDDAYLDDPPLHFVLADGLESVELEIERTPGVRSNVRVEVRPYSSREASRASARVMSRDGYRIGYFHLWLVQLADPDKLLSSALAGPLAAADALVFDLRGRGGNAAMIPRVLAVLDGPGAVWDRPVVALVDRQTRSAKDVLAYELRRSGRAVLVGQPTAGAAVPATFEEVGRDTYLMFPPFTYPRYTELIELRPVAPDVLVPAPGPYAGGYDPILQRGLTEAVRLARGSRDKESGQALDTDGLLLRMIRALGGEAALRSRQGLTMKGTFEIAGTPVTGTLVVQAAPPDKLLTTTDLGPMGVTVQGYDGVAGWTDGPGAGRVKLEGEALDRLRSEADFYGPLTYRERYESVKLDSLAEFAGRDAWVLTLTSKGGATSIQYVDAETFLLVGSRTAMDLMGNRVTVTTTLSDYREFDGMPVATVQRTDVGGFQQQKVTYTEVSFDRVPPRVFARPDWVGRSWLPRTVAARR